MAIDFGTALEVIGTAVGIKSAADQEKAVKAQRSANALARRQADLENARKRRELIRARRLAQAQNLAQAQAQGLSGSSVLAGVQGALSTNFASNFSFLDQTSALSTMQASFLDQAQFRQAQASVFGTASNLAFKSADLLNRT